jgi:transposase-like protein
MKRRFRCPVQTKRELVAEFMMGSRTIAVARRHGLSPHTLREWVRQYRDEAGDIMESKKQEHQQVLQAAANYEELKKQYEEALKLIGKLQLENNVLRDMVKKKYPDWKSH